MDDGLSYDGYLTVEILVGLDVLGNSDSVW